MKEALGKWLMDIAKYIMTAMLLTQVFTDIDKPIIFTMALIAVVILVVYGLYLIDKEKNNKKKKKGKKK